MANPMKLSLCYADSSSYPSDSASASFDVSNPCEGGLVEMVGFRLVGTAASQPSATTVTELVQSLRLTYNGNTVINWNSAVSSNASTGQSRLGAYIQSIGGIISEKGSATAIDCSWWIPLGVTLKDNSRFELTIGYSTSAAAFSSTKFEVWHKYGNSDRTTLTTNATSMAIPANSQTQVTVAVPNYGANATVSGIVVQGPSANEYVTSILVKELGNWGMSPTFLAGINGQANNGFEWADAGADTEGYQVSNVLDGFYFIPCYDLANTNGAVTILLTATNAETYTFTPIISLPVSGGAKAEPRQTASKATSASDAILRRAED